MTRSAKRTIKFPCVPVVQPIGEFFVAVVSANDLIEISSADIRHLDSELDDFSGIQRELKPGRVREIARYVQSPDASFPTSIILAVPAECTSINSVKTEMVFSPTDEIPLEKIARVIDGQHRIEGLKASPIRDFGLIVSIFVDMHISDQAYLFSTVNLAQTKVNKSLVYDLFELASTRSPQKTCHNISVALDRHPKSPFHHRIKRLGVATGGRFDETLTQATFVEALIRYVSRNPLEDRNTFVKGEKPRKATADELMIVPFRNMFLENRDPEIADVVWKYFDAVRKKWSTAWDEIALGNILNRSTGFRALIRFMKDAYLNVSQPGKVPDKEKFAEIFRRVKLRDNEFTRERFIPGSTGESTLYQELRSQTRI